MKRISEKRVIREWLKTERNKDEVREFKINSNISENEYLARLLAHKPDAASIFHKRDFVWFEHMLSKSEFEALRTVWEGEKVVDAAKDIDKSCSWLSADKVRKARSIADTYPDQSYPPLIISRRPSLGSDPYVDDGNHRAVGLALHMCSGGEYQPQRAFVGYPRPMRMTYIGRAGRKLRGLFHKYCNRA